MRRQWKGQFLSHLFWEVACVGRSCEFNGILTALGQKVFFSCSCVCLVTVTYKKNPSDIRVNLDRLHL